MMSTLVRVAFFIALLAVAPTLPQQRAPERILVRAGRLLDPVTGAVASNMTIVVRDGRIASIERSVSAAPGDSVIDLTSAFILPGLVDAHVHLAIGRGPLGAALDDARAGFTTVVDLGSRTNRLLRIRDSINAGGAPGPRVLASGMWIGRQGGVCEFNGLGIPGGPDDYAARVRQNVADGANVIKVCVTGWPAESFARPDSMEIVVPALEAVVREAHAAGRLVLAHAISRAGAHAAIAAGVDGLAHAGYLDAATTAAMRANNRFMISTLASLAGRDTSRAARELVRAVAAAHAAGVLIVSGTDGGVLPHGRNADELLALVAAGLSPLDVVRAATVNAARAFQLADSVGHLAPGMSADLVAVDDDPLRDLSVLRNPRFVMVRGRVLLP